MLLASVVVLSLLFSSPALAQVDGFDLWQEITEQQAAARLPAALKTTAQRGIVPQAYRTLALNKSSMAQLLAAAPAESPTRSPDDGSEILLPLPQGGYGRFSVLESPIMEPALAAQFPEIKTYILQGIDDPTATGRLDTSPKGFRAMVIGAEGTFFIDPYWSNNDDVSICYAKKDFTNADKLREWSCGVVGGGSTVAKAARSEKNAARPTGATLRVYRAAIAATAEYTAFHLGFAGAQAAIVTTLNRVNTVYERDFCIRMVLVANNNLLIYTNAATDPYTNGDAGLMIDENQTNIDNVIGNANYDIGHVFGTNSGGLAVLGVVCRTGFKAEGVTGSDAPVGDPFDIDYVAHEMGHQFNAEHTFNALSDPQRNATTAFEPGSGSTIMSYAGIVDGENLQEFANDYFHTGSYTEIDNYTSVAPGSGAISNIATGNSPPVIGALSNYTIPARTPFALAASATDANADTLTYCWEEYDVGPAQNPTLSPRDNGSSPIFRSYPGTTNPTRLFPSLQYILNNTNNPPATYTSNSISTWVTGETIPTTSRTMTYRVSVRDNRSGGGGQNWASAQVTTISNAGPFRISSQNAATTLALGTPFNVTWDVAGTTAAPISAANVKISLSTNGGTNFPVVLAASVPNNGSASVTIPAGNTTTAGRIKVEAVGNIFFDINDANLTIPSAAQTTIFSENVGVPTATTSITAYSAGTAPATFENKGVLTYGQGDQALAADVRATSPSSGYAGASGGGNVFFTSTANAYGFSIEGINASGLSSLSLVYGYRKDSGTVLPSLSVDYWNGSAWVTIASAPEQLFNEAANAAAGWYLAKTLALPAAAQIVNLKIRFVKSGTTALRIDDIKLTGEVPAGSPIISSFTPAFGLAGTTVTITGSDLTGATTVSFGGVNATSFTVVGPTSITAQVPVGAVTGKISVTTPQGTATSLADFFVSATPPPALAATPTSISGLTTTAGTASASANYTLVASNLTGNLVIGPTTAAYEVSTNGTTWASTLTLPQTAGSLSNTVFVRLSAAASAGSANASISNSIVGSGSSLTNLPTLSGLVEPTGTPGLIYWSFSSATPTSGVPSGWVVEAISRGNNMATNALLESASVSSGYTNPFGVAASGTFNATVGAVGGAINTATNAYYEIKIVPSSSSAITNISFGARSTSSGPQAYTVRSSADNFTTDLATGTLLANSAWAMKVNAPVTVALSNGTNTLRIYGYNGTNVTGVSANWRIDDLTLAVGSLGPIIAVVPSSIVGLTATQGTPGAIASFTASASSLSNNITVTANDAVNFAISTNNTDFTNTLTLPTNATGGLSNTPVYVRLTGAAPFGPKSNTVTLSSDLISTNVIVTGTVIDPAAPNIAADPIALSNFATLRGTVSSNQTVTITGTNLGGSNIAVVSSNNFYEISTNSFATPGSNSLTLASTGGVVAVRIATNAPATNSLLGNLALSGGGATNNVPLSGVVTNLTPSITVVPTNSLSFSSTVNVASSAQSFTAAGANLSNNITVTAPTGFSVAFTTNNTDFTNTLTLTNSGGIATNREVFVRMDAAAAATNLSSRNVTLATTGASNQVAVSGTITTAPPSLTATPALLADFETVTGTASAVQSYVLSGSNLSTVTVTAPLGFQVALANNNAAFGPSVSPAPAGGVLNTNIFVRVSAAAVANANLTGNVANVSGAASTNVVLQARVLPLPTLGASPTTLSNLYTVTGIASTNQSFNLTASNLLGPVNLSVTNGFEISTNASSGFTTNLAVPLNSAADDAGNYSAGWTNGANGGFGFGPWTITVSNSPPTYFAGAFIGDPNSAGITGFGTNAFGLYANPQDTAATVLVDRPFTSPLKVGETFSFQWAVNWDAGNGNKGFNVYSGGTNGTQLVNVNQGDFPGNITCNGANAITNFGSGPMTWAFTVISSNNLRVTSTARDGSTNIVFTTNIPLSAPPDAVRWYTTAMTPGDQRQPYFDNLQISAFPGGSITNLPIYVRIATNAPVAPATNSLLSRVTVSSPLAPPGPALITYVGSETGLPGNDYAVQNWSNPGVAKAYDIGGSEVYGSAGYYQIRPTLNSSPSNVNEPVGAGNDLGILAVSNTTLFSLPAFLSSATGGAGSFVNFGGYSTYRGPDGSTIFRQGALSVSVNNGPFNSPAGNNASYYGAAMSVKLNATANFRLGLAVDSVGTGNFAPNYVSIYSPTAGSVFSGALTRDGNADMAFFDIQGAAGDTFDVALWQNTGTQSVAALSLATFDVIPNPAATTNIFVNLSGTVEERSITVTPSELTDFIAYFNTPSDPQSFDVGAIQLTGTILVSAPSKYEVSLTSSGNYTNQISIPAPPLGSAVEVWVRLKIGASVGPADEEITLTSIDAATKLVSLTGEVLDPLQPARNADFVDIIHELLLYRPASPTEIAKYSSADFLGSIDGFASNIQKSKVIMDVMGFTNTVTANPTNNWSNSYFYTNEYVRSAGTIFALLQRFGLPPQASDNAGIVEPFVQAVRAGSTNRLTTTPTVDTVSVATATVGLAQAVDGFLNTSFFTNSANAPVLLYSLNGPVRTMSDYLQGGLFKSNNSPVIGMNELRATTYSLMQSNGMAALAPNTNTYATAVGITMYSVAAQSGLIPDFRSFGGNSGLTATWRNWVLSLNQTALDFQLWENGWNFSTASTFSVSSVTNLLRVPVVIPTNVIATNGVTFSNYIELQNDAAPINSWVYFTASNLPPWAYITPAGSILGTPTAPGNYTSTVTAQNIAGWSAPQKVVLQVSGAQSTNQAQTWMAANYPPGTNTLYNTRNDDTDRDGFTSASEYAFGSNPNVPNASIMNFSNVSANVMRITWNGLTNQTYTLQVSTNLVGSPAWTNRPGALISTNGPLISTNGVFYQPLRTDVTNTGASNAFYRIWTGFSQQALE